LWKKRYRPKSHKNASGKLGKFEQKSFASPKIASSYTYDKGVAAEFAMPCLSRGNGELKSFLSVSRGSTVIF